MIFLCDVIYECHLTPAHIIHIFMYVIKSPRNSWIYYKYKNDTNYTVSQTCGWKKNDLMSLRFTIEITRWWAVLGFHIKFIDCQNKYSN